MQKTNVIRFGAPVLAGLGLASAVQAAVPPEATAALTGLQTDAAAMIAAAWPVVAAVVVGFVLIGLFKRAASKV